MLIWFIIIIGKSLPVHCIIEQIPGPQACGQHVELDSYAIVPCDTPFNDLVRTALGKLGYSTSQILGAKGKNWTYYFLFSVKCLYYNRCVIEIFNSL